MSGEPQNGSAWRDQKSWNGSGCSAPCLALPRCPTDMSTSSGYCGYPGVVSDPIRRKVSSSPPFGTYWWMVSPKFPAWALCSWKLRACLVLWKSMQTWQPHLGTVSWVCKNARPVALKMPEPLGSKYECSVFTYPRLIPGSFFLPIFLNFFQGSQLTSSLGIENQRFLTGFCIGVWERETALSYWSLLCTLKLLSPVHFQNCLRPHKPRYYSLFKPNREVFQVTWLLFLA